MVKTSPDLHATAKLAYERGRLELAGRRALPPVALTALAVLLFRAPLSTAVPLGVLLALVFGYTQYRGLSIGRGARRGLVLGVLPFGVPVLVETSGACWIAGSCAVTCMVACVVAGSATGLVLARSAARDDNTLGYAFAGGVLLLLVAGLGCTAIGLGQFLGVTVGLALAAPAYFWRQAGS